MADDIDFKVAAVLPAGGVGQRMGLEIPKQFVNINGRPLICFALDTFESVPWIFKVAVPVATEWRGFMDNIIKNEGYSKVVLSDGKDTRHQSIYEGIKSLKDSSPDVVIIHDAVRPLIEEMTLRSIAIAARNFGASGAVRPLVSTILVANEDGFLDHSLVRSQCRASEMPQAFRYDIINNAYCKATENDLVYGTECLHLALKYTGTKAKLIEGPSSLWKVTYQSDLDALERILDEQSKRDIVICSSTETVSNFYQDFLENLSTKCYKLHIIKPLRNVTSLQETGLLMNDKKRRTLKKIVLFFLESFSDGLGTSQLRLLCQENELMAIVFISTASEVINAMKEFLKETRGDSSIQSTICCVVYQNSYMSKVDASVSGKIADLLQHLIKYECKSFHGQIFEF